MSDDRFAYRLACGCIALGAQGLSEHDKLACPLHYDDQLIAGFGIRWSLLQAESRAS